MSGSQWASGSDYTHKHNFSLCSKGIDLFFGTNQLLLFSTILAKNHGYCPWVHTEMNRSSFKKLIIIVIVLFLVVVKPVPRS